MTTIPIINIQRFLQERDPIALGYEQFAVDWIEDTLDRIEEILEAEEITTDDETYCGALHYRVENILEIMRANAVCYLFFVELSEFLQGKEKAVRGQAQRKQLTLREQKAILMTVREVRRIATMETSAFDEIATPAASDLPKTEKQVNAFIRNRTRLWRDSWILRPLDKVIETLEANEAGQPLSEEVA